MPVFRMMISEVLQPSSGKMSDRSVIVGHVSEGDVRLGQALRLADPQATLLQVVGVQGQPLSQADLPVGIVVRRPDGIDLAQLVGGELRAEVE